MHSLVLASFWSIMEMGVEGVDVFEVDFSLILDTVGGVGFRLGGSFQLAGERSSFSLVVWEASGPVSLLT